MFQNISKCFGEITEGVPVAIVARLSKMNYEDGHCCFRASCFQWESCRLADKAGLEGSMNHGETKNH